MNKTYSIVVAATIALGLIPDAQAVAITGLTSAGTLITFDSAAPQTLLSTNAVTGLTVGDTLVAIDYRPADGALIGFGYNTTTGNASVYTLTLGVATATATSVNANVLSLGTGLARVTADFNPTANAIRVVTSGSPQNNFRIGTAGTGPLATDTALSPTNTGIVATAYSRNNPGGGTSGATTLYVIDGPNNTLVTQGSVDFFTGNGGTSPNTGTLFNVNTLSGVTGSAVTGFDIFNVLGTSATSAGSAFLSTGTTLYSFDLGTAAATSLGNFAVGQTINDIAVVPEPSSLMLIGLAGVGLAFYVRARRTA